MKQSLRQKNRRTVFFSPPIFLPTRYHSSKAYNVKVFAKLFSKSGGFVI